MSQYGPRYPVVALVVSTHQRINTVALFLIIIFNYNPLSINSVTVVASDLTMSIFFYYTLIQLKLFLEFNQNH